MPTYDYECDACGHRFEKFQPITAKAIRVCPKCDEREVRRLIGTGAGVIFKGSGFYQTDYRSDSYRKDAEKAKSASEDSTSADGKSKDSATKSDKAQAKTES